MFALTIKPDRMKNKEYEIEAAQPLLGKYVVLLLKEGKVVRKISSYDKSEIYKKIYKLAEARDPEGDVLGPRLHEEDSLCSDA